MVSHCSTDVSNSARNFVSNSGARSFVIYFLRFRRSKGCACLRTSGFELYVWCGVKAMVVGGSLS